MGSIWRKGLSAASRAGNFQLGHGLHECDDTGRVEVYLNLKTPARFSPGRMAAATPRAYNEIVNQDSGGDSVRLIRSVLLGTTPVFIAFGIIAQKYVATIQQANRRTVDPKVIGHLTRSSPAARGW
jgi:hypothetical protein